jgi:hypothetical protein
MNNFDRNTRTLIVSFLIAIFALIPLRFVEVGQQEQSMMMNAQVLGDSIVASEEKQIEVTSPVLEEPYNEIEKCIDKNEIKDMEDGVIKLIKDGGMTKDQMVTVLDELQSAEDNVCP